VHVILLLTRKLKRIVKKVKILGHIKNSVYKKEFSSAMENQL